MRPGVRKWLDMGFEDCFDEMTTEQLKLPAADTSNMSGVDNVTWFDLEVNVRV